MEPGFSLLRTDDYSIFEKNFLQKSGADGFALAPKSYIRFLPRILAKMIAWWRFPDMRVSNVSNAFNRCIERTTTQSVGELTNLYIHAKNFNSRVIKNHNNTWLFWARVPMLNLNRLEAKIKTELQASLSSLQTHTDEQAVKSAVGAIDGIADPTLLPIELRLLHARLDTACQIFSHNYAQTINNELEALKTLDVWTAEHIAKITDKIQPTVDMFSPKDPKVPASKVNMHTETWQALKTKLSKMLSDGDIKKKMTESAERELEGMKERVDDLKKRLEKARRSNFADLCVEIRALPSIPTHLEALNPFLPQGSEVDSKIETVKNTFEFIRKVAGLQPAHAAKLEEYKKEAPNEIKRREEAFENYGDIGSRGLNQRTTELVEYLRQAYAEADHPVVEDFKEDVRVLHNVQGICRDAKKLLTFKVVPSDLVEASSKSVEVDALLAERYEKAERVVPKLYKKWKALRDEIAALWRPIRRTHDDQTE